MLGMLAVQVGGAGWTLGEDAAHVLGLVNSPLSGAMGGGRRQGGQGRRGPGKKAQQWIMQNYGSRDAYRQARRQWAQQQGFKNMRQAREAGLEWQGSFRAQKGRGGSQSQGLISIGNISSFL